MKNFSNLSKNAHGKRNLRGVSSVMLLTIGCMAMTTACNKKPEQVADAPSPVEQKSDSVPVDTVVEKVDSTAIKLEEFKEFTTNDLAAFMLHGKVKTMTITGQVAETYYFSEEGVLVSVSISERGFRSSIKHSGTKLTIDFSNPNDPYGGWTYVHTVDGSGKLISEQYGSDETGSKVTYSGHDANGWPVRYKATEDEIGEQYNSSGSISYSGIDEYGNWTKRSGLNMTRKITYYPVE